MKKHFRNSLIFVLVVFLFMSLSSIALAHPGRTDSYGGHYVRTAGWGYPVGSYHYHSGPYAGYTVNYQGEIPAAFKKSSGSSGASASVPKVTKIYGKVVDYSVSINNVSVDSINNKYPILSYKNITYIPLTYEMGAALGIVTAWSDSTGLSISKGTPSGSAAFVQDLNTRNEAGQNKEIAIAQFNVYLNGQWINNAEQTYPFITFNNITYMPLTWDNASQLGLGLNWDNQNGLNIGL